MKNLDKKSIILLATLLAVAVIIIVFSQNILDKTGGNKFGSSYTASETTETTETTVVETSETTTVETTEESPEEPSSETTAVETTVVETSEEPRELETYATTETIKPTVYGSFELDNAYLSISEDNKYLLTNKAGDAAFSGNIRDVKTGDDIPVSNRRLKKIGIDSKQVDKNRMICVQLQYDKHEFVKDGQTVTCYFNSNIHAKKDSFNVIILYDDNNVPCVYDVNGDVSKLDFNNYYF